jgi:uncharacterized membrane protein
LTVASEASGHMSTAASESPATTSWSVRKAVVLLASILGLGISTYLTIVHYDTHLVLACANNGTINCEKVTSSAQSRVFGIPVAVLGLAFFVAMVALSLPAAWRATSVRIAQLRLASVIVGIGFVFYLIYSELFTIHAICLWCSGVHVLTFVLFVAIVTGWDEATAGAYIDDEG